MSQRWTLTGEKAGSCKCPVVRPAVLSLGRHLSTGRDRMTSAGIGIEPGRNGGSAGRSAEICPLAWGR